MLGYVSGLYDILRAKDLQKLDMAIQKNAENGNQYFAVALYDNSLCEELGLNEPLKSIDDRLKIVEQLSGVDFAFPIDTLDSEKVSVKAKEALNNYLALSHSQPASNLNKPYKLAYAPGTYDLFHAGHLENLLEASSKSDVLIVGVKSDELVENHKGRNPMISAEERMEILRHFKFVDNVYQYYTRDPHVAVSWINSKYHGSVDAIFLGSDLKADFKGFHDLPIIFTDRDEKNMHTRSTSGYLKKLKLRSVPVSSDSRYTKGTLPMNQNQPNPKIDLQDPDLE